MSSNPRNLHRFLPTLTEVVSPPVMPADTLTQPSDGDAIVQDAMVQIDAVIKREIVAQSEALVHSLVESQLQLVRDQFRPQIESIVRQAVADALPATAFHKRNS